MLSLRFLAQVEPDFAAILPKKMRKNMQLTATL